MGDEGDAEDDGMDDGAMNGEPGSALGASGDSGTNGLAAAEQGDDVAVAIPAAAESRGGRAGRRKSSMEAIRLKGILQKTEERARNAEVELMTLRSRLDTVHSALQLALSAVQSIVVGQSAGSSAAVPNAAMLDPRAIFFNSMQQMQSLLANSVQQAQTATAPGMAAAAGQASGLGAAPATAAATTTTTSAADASAAESSATGPSVAQGQDSNTEVSGHNAESTAAAAADGAPPGAALTDAVTAEQAA